MRIYPITIAVSIFLAQAFFPGATVPARAQADTSPYAAMAPVNQYLMPEGAEIAMARSAAPPSISDGAQVMVLRREGYIIVAKGGNGFVCTVQRSWAASTDFPEFWNFKIRAPICWNAAAAKTSVPLMLKKTQWVLAGKPKAEIAKAVASAFDTKEVPPLEPSAMCFMMARQQYLSDRDKGWHPHMMWFVPGDAAKSWGAGLPGSPVLAADDPEDRMTIMLVGVTHWSDGTPAPQESH